MVDPRPGELIMDPACGSGGFLTVALEHVWASLDTEAKERDGPHHYLSVASARSRLNARGMDKDDFLAKVPKHISRLSATVEAECSASIVAFSHRNRGQEVREKVRLGTFESSSRTLHSEEDPRRWQATLSNLTSVTSGTTNKETGAKELAERSVSDLIRRNFSFVERSLQLLKPGGRLGIILPESLFGSPSYSFIIDWLQSKATILAVAAMPEPLFKTSGKAGTHTKVCMVVLRKHDPKDRTEENLVFMADAKWCGHDSRGNPTLRREHDERLHLLDDIPTIAENYVRFKKLGLVADDHLGFMQPRVEDHRNSLHPEVL